MLRFIFFGIWLLPLSSAFPIEKIGPAVLRNSAVLVDNNDDKLVPDEVIRKALVRENNFLFKHGGFKDTPAYHYSFKIDGSGLRTAPGKSDQYFSWSVNNGIMCITDQPDVKLCFKAIVLSHVGNRYTWNYLWLGGFAVE